MKLDENLVNALREIKKECSKHNDCEECLLYSWDYKGCFVIDDLCFPCDWDID